MKKVFFILALSCCVSTLVFADGTGTAPDVNNSNYPNHPSRCKRMVIPSVFIDCTSSMASVSFTKSYEDVTIQIYEDGMLAYEVNVGDVTSGNSFDVPFAFDSDSDYTIVVKSAGSSVYTEDL